MNANQIQRWEPYLEGDTQGASIEWEPSADGRYVEYTQVKEILDRHVALTQEGNELQPIGYMLASLLSALKHGQSVMLYPRSAGMEMVPVYAEAPATSDAEKAIRRAALEEAATICDEYRDLVHAEKDSALLVGKINLSNAMSGEPRAASFLASAIRDLATKQR